MLFNTLAYARFFAITFVMSWALVPLRRVRLAFLLGASYFFYAGWSAKFLPLVFACSTLDYVLGRVVERAKRASWRKALLAFTLLSNLGILAVFKYWNFGVETVTWLAARLGLTLPDLHHELALPIGISFFTFMSLSYVVDVYRGKIPACRSYLEYLTFIAFFPHLVAGPIVRGRDLLPALARPVELTADMGGEAMFLIAVGLVKKVIIGDYLALNLVDRVFSAPPSYSALETLVAMYAYAIQLFCDFSGYSDIAVGSALLLGYRFPKNFDAPFKARNMADFWRRWHTSLSDWLRDYVYIPLGGSKNGRFMKYINVFITMVVCGVWHGAAWSFVAFGAVQGASVVAAHWFRDLVGATPEKDARSPVWLRALGVIATFNFVAFTFVLFRASSVTGAVAVWSRLRTLTTYHPNLHEGVLAVVVAALLLQWSPSHMYRASKRLFTRIPAPAQAAALFGLALALREMAATEAVPFVYFQF